MIASVVLPKAYLKSRYALTKSGDRGIKKIMEKNGQSIVYEPAVKWRKYVEQYILSERYGRKQMICKIDPEIGYLAYDVVLFNNRNEVFDVLEIKEKTDGGGYTKTIDLPEETSYVALSITEVDATQFTVPITQKVAGGRITAFLLWCSLCLFMEVFCVKACCANIFGGIFRQSFMLDGESTAATLVIALVLIIINLAVSLPVILIRGAKKTERKTERNK